MFLLSHLQLDTEGLLGSEKIQWDRSEGKHLHFSFLCQFSLKDAAAFFMKGLKLPPHLLRYHQVALMAFHGVDWQLTRGCADTHVRHSAAFQISLRDLRPLLLTAVRDHEWDSSQGGEKVKGLPRKIGLRFAKLHWSLGSNLVLLCPPAAPHRRLLTGAAAVACWAFLGSHLSARPRSSRQQAC